MEIIEDLESNLCQLEIELERKNQEAYNLKNQVSLLSSSEIDYIEEIERIKDEEAQKGIDLTSQTKNLESCLNAIINDYTEKLQEDNELITAFKTEKTQLEHRINEKKRKQEEANKMKLKNQSLVKNDNQQLLDKINMQIELLEQKHLDLDMTKDLKEILNQHQYNYKCHLEELKVVKDKAQCLQDEIRVNETCLDVLKNVPMDPSQQGNSMFAEVKDSLEKLQQKVAKMTKHCSAIEKTFILQSEETKRVQQETEKLCKDLDSINDCVNLDTDEMVSLDKQINELNETVEEYYNIIEEDEHIKGNYVPIYAVEFANSCIKSKWADSVKMCRHLRWIFKETFDTSNDLLDKNFELRKSKRKVFQLKFRAEELENRLMDLQHNLLMLENVEKTSEQKLNNSYTIFQHDTENIYQNLDNVNLENEKVDLSQFIPEENIINTPEAAKILISSMENIIVDGQSYEEICKSDSAKNYYILTHMSPQYLQDETIDQILS